MIDIDKNLEIFYEREENKEDEYIGAISKHECVVDGWFVIELLEEVKRLREVNDDLICDLEGFQEAVKEDEAGYKDLVASLEGIEEELKAEVKRLRETVKTVHNLNLWEKAEVKRLGEKNELLRSMQKDGIEASAHDRLLLEINRLREDNEKLHDAINRSFHAKISGSALEIYNGWWEGEEE